MDEEAMQAQYEGEAEAQAQAEDEAARAEREAYEDEQRYLAEQQGTEEEPMEQKFYVMIENQGEIDANAFKLLGASTKRADNTKIGFFGSGLKYALAVMLKKNIEFAIYSGTKEIKVTTSKTKFRDQVFEVIKVNGEKTSMTTDMGVDWQTWFVVREVFCNAEDEGGATITVMDKMEPKEGVTRFFIEMTDDIKDMTKSWGKYFANKRKDLVTEIVRHDYYLDTTKKIAQVFEGRKIMVVYRKGIQVYLENKPCLYHYNFEELDINESRTIRSVFDLEWRIVYAWKEGATKEMLEKLFERHMETYEWKMDWSYGSDMFNDMWLEMLQDKKLVIDELSGYFQEQIEAGDCVILPKKLVDALEKKFPELKILGREKKGSKTVLEMDERQKIMLDKAKTFLQQGGFEIPYSIEMAELDYPINGEAELETNRIYLAPRAFKKGTKALVTTLVEEFAHLDSKQADKTRSFQNYLIQMFVTELEKSTGVVL